MGKIRVKTIGDEEAELKLQGEHKKKKEARIASLTDARRNEAKLVQKEDIIESSDETGEVTEVKKNKKYVKKTTSSKKTHSKSYSSVKEKVEAKRTYSVPEGIELLKKLQRAKFDETVELHITTLEQGVSGHVTLPHGTGKKTKVVITTEEIIAEIEKGKIEFDILVAEPAIMPKLAKVARILGPKGLMPNPKNGTVTANPQDLVKKYEGGQINFKTEGKAPVIHLTIGKASFEDKKLADNIKAIYVALGKNKIASVFLKSTMSPGIKLTF
ncbi:MAG: 50S ribosomal protein L1 [Candidatus Levybacteria bacterium CG_4_10_14_0_2_um_filter_35_8]|nr:MAG: 50S ribosomal protein L1 [Candidatus Levybacteria bacterium CG_4_10_14_0_8_um_filter_35_23]PJA00165.1 MAG: 50S ribosomal protein L1 [Candidatus Levybacteria bacterium CG_4_10_14_0_2_um_filter_35_8]PJC54007.1 MAG: 50S ribosomal protein L1 [Candidatus Levybacteria bacterium CG_4_9_14_0_2_um_filter_35_21]